MYVRSLKQDEAKTLPPQLLRDGQGTAEPKSCEKYLPEGGRGSPDTLTSSDALTTASFPAEESEGVPGVISDESQEVTKHMASAPGPQ